MIAPGQTTNNHQRKRNNELESFFHNHTSSEISLEPGMISRLILLTVFTTTALAQKPDLHAGGARPSSIPNHETSKVTLPGYHLAHATFTVGGACTLVSYTATENQIVFTVTGARSISDHDGYCDLNVKNSAGQASTWIIVSLTESEVAQQQADARAIERQRFSEFVSRSGSKWILHFNNGATETYTSKSSNDDGVPLFTNSTGAEFKIMVGNDFTVTIIGESCYRTGKLSNGHVTNGSSMGTCTPPGSWTAVRE